VKQGEKAMMKSINRIPDQDARMFQLITLLQTAPQSIKDAIEREMMLAIEIQEQNGEVVNFPK
jgi:hypothetical protein